MNDRIKIYLFRQLLSAINNWNESVPLKEHPHTILPRGKVGTIEFGNVPDVLVRRIGHLELLMSCHKLL